MPKQLFQRPAPIKHGKIGKQQSSPYGPGAKTQKPPKPKQPSVTPTKPEK